MAALFACWRELRRLVTGRMMTFITSILSFTLIARMKQTQVTDDRLRSALLSGVSAWVSDAPFCIVEIQLLIVFFVHQLSMLLCFQLVLACLALCVLSKEG